MKAAKRKEQYAFKKVKGKEDFNKLLSLVSLAAHRIPPFFTKKHEKITSRVPDLAKKRKADKNIGKKSNQIVFLNFVTKNKVR